MFMSIFSFEIHIRINYVTLTTSAYFEEVVKKHNEYDLPKEFREQEDLESDESESEESDWIL